MLEQPHVHSTERILSLLSVCEVVAGGGGVVTTCCMTCHISITHPNGYRNVMGRKFHTHPCSVVPCTCDPSRGAISVSITNHHHSVARKERQMAVGTQCVPTISHFKQRGTSIATTTTTCYLKRETEGYSTRQPLHPSFRATGTIAVSLMRGTLVLHAKGTTPSLSIYYLLITHISCKYKAIKE